MALISSFIKEFITSLINLQILKKVFFCKTGSNAIFSKVVFLSLIIERQVWFSISISRLCENMLKKVLGANWEPLCLRAGLLLCLALVALLLCFSTCVKGVQRLFQGIKSSHNKTGLTFCYKSL